MVVFECRDSPMVAMRFRIGQGAKTQRREYGNKNGQALHLRALSPWPATSASKSGSSIGTIVLILIVLAVLGFIFAH